MQTTPAEVRKFELEARLADGSKYEYEYSRKEGRVSAKVQIKDKEGNKSRQQDQASVEAVEKLLDEVAPYPHMSEEELLRKARAALHAAEGAIDRLEVEVEFADGTEIEAEEQQVG